MPRTKYIVILFCILVGILLVLAGYFSLRDSNIALGGVDQSALAIQSDPEPILVSIEKNETRSKMRDALRASLENFTSTEPASAVLETNESNETESVEQVATELEPEPQVVDIPECLDETDSQNGIETWSDIHIKVEGGIRHFTSKETNTDGVPLYELKTLELPEVLETPRCVSDGTVVGVAMDGRLLRGSINFASNAEGIVGYARDGFGVFSPYEDGKELTSTDLDICHGHVHPIVWDGQAMSLYHYHVTNDSPYTVGCYRGTPVPLP